jgi:hypothetical protein
MLAAGLAMLVTVTGIEITPAFGASTAISTQAVCHLKVVKGLKADGPVVLNGSTQLMTAASGRINLYASEKGKWQMANGRSCNRQTD